MVITMLTIPCLSRVIPRHRLLMPGDRGRGFTNRLLIPNRLRIILGRREIYRLSFRNIRLFLWMFVDRSNLSIPIRTGRFFPCGEIKYRQLKRLPSQLVRNPIYCIVILTNRFCPILGKSMWLCSVICCVISSWVLRTGLPNLCTDSRF